MTVFQVWPFFNVYSCNVELHTTWGPDRPHGLFLALDGR